MFEDLIKDGVSGMKASWYVAQEELGLAPVAVEDLTSQQFEALLAAARSSTVRVTAVSNNIGNVFPDLLKEG